MNELNKNYIDTLFKAAENVNTLFSVVYKVAANINYPALNNIMESAQEFNRQIFLVANYIYNPNSENFVDAVTEQLTINNPKVNEND